MNFCLLRPKFPNLVICFFVNCWNGRSRTNIYMVRCCKCWWKKYIRCKKSTCETVCGQVCQSTGWTMTHSLKFRVGRNTYQYRSFPCHFQNNVLLINRTIEKMIKIFGKILGDRRTGWTRPTKYWHIVIGVKAIFVVRGWTSAGSCWAHPSQIVNGSPTTPIVFCCFEFRLVGENTWPVTGHVSLGILTAIFAIKFRSHCVTWGWV